MARKSRKNSFLAEMPVADIIEDEKIPTAIYGRLSIENGDSEDSMDTQIALIQEYIDGNDDLKYIDTYFDNGFTGTNFNRPAFNRLMDDVRKKKIRCIVVKDLSRFGRNYLEAGYYIETIFPFLGVRLIAVTDNFDSSRKENMEGISVPIRNLIRDIPINLTEVTADQRKGIEFVLTQLTEREQLILAKRYQEGLSYAKIGTIYDLTGSRVEQIMNRTLRRLRHSSRKAYIIES